MATSVDPAATTLDQPTSAFADRSFFGHPKGLRLLFFVEMWERFSYYGMRALLVLYLVNHLKWSVGDAARLYGTYTALVYLTPLIGGWIADRFIGTRRSLVIGGIIIASGHFVLALQNTWSFYLGLGLVVAGTGFFKPNVSTMVGQIYRDGDTRRDSGFTIYYMGINTGAFLAPLVCGYLGQRVGWHWGFAAAGVGMVLGLIQYIYGRDKLLPGIGYPPGRAQIVGTSTRIADAPAAIASGGLVPALVGAAIGAVIAFASGGAAMSYLFGIVIGAALGLTLMGSRGEERRRVIAIFLVCFFVVFFWMAFEQAGSSMNLFADRYTNLQVGSWAIPSTWFQSVNSLFIILLAIPVAGFWESLSRRSKEPSTALKMVLGLFLVGIGFLFLVIGSRSIDACIAVHGKTAADTSGICAVASPIWLILAYLFHTLGELCLSPVGLSYVTKVAPVRFVSLLMGVWFLANSAANFLAGLLAARTETISSQAKFFTIPVYTSIGAGILLLILVPLIKKLTAGVKA